MTREEAIKKLEPFIPSLTRDYYRWGEKKVDKTKDRSWIYRDGYYERPNAKWNDPHRQEYIPEQIPEHFLEGTEVEVDGEKFVIRRTYPERDYRRVHLQVTDFADYGNTHKYGQLQIDGVYWGDFNNNSHTHHGWFKLTDIEPRVRNIWDVDLFRIVGEGEMSGSECPVGEATGRFVYLDELITTAAYVTLLRIQGPAILDNASSYAATRTKEDIILSVDGDGNVELGDELKRILKLD